MPHTHHICAHPHTQARTQAHITTAIVKGDLAVQHEPRLLQTRCLQASSPFSGTPSHRPVQFSGGLSIDCQLYPQTLHSRMESGHDSPTQLGRALFPSHPVIVQSLIRPLGNSGITPSRPHHEREHSRVGHFTPDTAEVMRRREHPGQGGCRLHLSPSSDLTKCPAIRLWFSCLYNGKGNHVGIIKIKASHRVRLDDSESPRALLPSGGCQ